MMNSLPRIAVAALALFLSVPAKADNGSLAAANARLGVIPPSGITPVKDVVLNHFRENRVAATAVMRRGAFTEDDIMNVMKCAVDRFAESKGFDEWALNINNIDGTPAKMKFTTVYTMFKPPYPESLKLMEVDPCTLIPEQAKDSYGLPTE